MDELPKEALFHYTDAGGLLGMIKSKSIWLSHINYQNDSKEFYHAVELINDLLKREYRGLDLWLSNADFNIEETVYTFSLSKKKDLLSQWRGYCPNGGYSISFNKDQIETMMQTYNLSVYKCLYDMDSKIELIKQEILGVTPEEYASSLEQNDDNFDSMCKIDARWLARVPRQLKLLKRQINKYAPIMKHESFSEEEEFRLVTDRTYSRLVGGPRDEGLDPLPFPIEFRERNNKIVPYVAAVMAEGNPILIDEIVIGPNPDPELSKSACELLLKGTKAWISNSNIPYKNW